MNARALLLAALLLGVSAAWAQPAAPGGEDRKDYSAAERLLFLSRHLEGIKPPQTLHYGFHRAGTLEPGFDDKVSITLTRLSNGQCCSAQGEFLSGPRRLDLPLIALAEGNPVTMFFLEREIREMNRLTKGSQSHFRKRIRMAVYQGATVSDVTLRYQGRAVQGQQVDFAPYADDPNRPRYEKLATKQFRFLLSDAVPGTVYSIRTSVIVPDQAAPLLVEELTIEGGERTPP